MSSDIWLMEIHWETDWEADKLAQIPGLDEYNSVVIV